MKRILTILFFLVSLSSFCADISEYRLYLDAKKHFDENELKKSKEKFVELFEKHENSNLVKSTLPHFYLGKIYFLEKEYDNALNYLEKTTYHSEETKLLIGQSEKILGKDTAKEKFLALYTDKYDYNINIFEPKALNELSVYDIKYKYIYEIKYAKNFENIDKLDSEDLNFLGNYFYSVGKYDLTLKCYEASLKKKHDDDVEVKILKTMFNQKRYTDIIPLAKKYLETNKYKSQIYYHLGNSYRRKGQIKNGIETLKKVQSDSLKNSTNFIIGKLYYYDKDYNSAIEYLNKSNYLSAMDMKIECYEKLKDTENYRKTLAEYIRKKPYSDRAAYYRYKLYRDEKNQNYLDWIIEYNINSYYYELASNTLNKEKKLSQYDVEIMENKYSTLIEKVNALVDLNFYEGASIELRYANIPKEDRIFRIYLKTKILEGDKKYHLAIKNSYYNPFLFSKYDNLITNLYPVYYKELVEKYAEKYDVDKYLVYSVIKQESLFKEDDISSASAYGLMQIILPTARMFKKNITYQELLNPETNIKIGVQYLRFLLKKFNNNYEKAVASYNAGPGNVSKWLDKDGTLDIETIPYAETKKYVKKVLNNYYKYKRFYR